MLEERVCYPALALTVLAVFYGIYFGPALLRIPLCLSWLRVQDYHLL